MSKESKKVMGLKYGQITDDKKYNRNKFNYIVTLCVCHEILQKIKNVHFHKCHPEVSK